MFVYISSAVCLLILQKSGASCFVDAPVSGGVNAASAGTLTFMVGAPSAEEFEQAKDILQHMGKAIGKKHALKRYIQFALNTSCFWGSTG